MSQISWPALWLQVDTRPWPDSAITWSHSSLASLEDQLFMQSSSYVFSANYYVAIMLMLTTFETDVKEYVVKHCMNLYFYYIYICMNLYVWCDFIKAKRKQLSGQKRRRRKNGWQGRRRKSTSAIKYWHLFIFAETSEIPFCSWVKLLIYI